MRIFPSEGPDQVEGTLLAVWSRLWRQRPSAPIFRQPGGPWWSAESIEAASSRIAGRLQGIGLEPGDRVLWSTHSSVEAIVAHLGVLRAGMVVVPINVAATGREIAHIVRVCQPSAAIIADPQWEEWSEFNVGSLLVVGTDVAVADHPCHSLDLAQPDDPALICFTSGTTGAPKGAVLRHRNLLAGAEALGVAWQWDGSDHLVHCLPVFHAHGLCVGIYGTLYAGGSATLLPKFEVESVIDEVNDPRSTMFFGVPTMYHRLLHSGRAKALARLRLSVSGSAPLSAQMHGDLAAVGVHVLERYGMTETLMLTSNPYEGERRPGSVGLPLPGVELRIVADGEIHVRGPSIFDHYWDEPAMTATSFVPDDPGSPWFRTGDLGEVASDGYVTIRGRSKELIITGGFNVYPAEVEGVLQRCPGVVEVAVAGTPSEEWGESVTAWVVGNGTAIDRESILSFVGKQLAPYKIPRRIVFVDELPRNALGKLLRSELQ